MRPSPLDVDPDDLRIRGRLTAAQRLDLRARVGAARATGHAVSILFIHAPVDPLPWLDAADWTARWDGGLYLALIPRCHIDRACALAERLVRQTRDARVRVGVAQVLSGTYDLDATLERAEQALSEAVVSGPVASMHWADISREAYPVL